MALSITSLIQSARSVSIIKGVLCNSKWAHDVAGLNNPCAFYRVRFSVDAAKKLCDVPVKKKKPLTAHMFMLHDPFPRPCIN